ncbi:MAG: dihydrofolate reductase [bacterium]|nr:dihydrofolate reductase [bacterium]
MILVAAMTEDRVIGKNNSMPWHISEESRLFRKLTRGGTVLMGRTTFESLGSRPLSKRNNIVISRTLPEQEGIHVCRTVEEAVEKAAAFPNPIYSIGGAEIYRQTLPLADALYISYIKKNYDGDTHFPDFDKNEWEIEKEEDHDEFVFVIYKKKSRSTTSD